MFSTTDRDDEFVKMPLSIKLSGRSPADISGKLTAKLFGPKADRLVRHNDPTLGQQIFDHAQALRKAEIQPDRMSDHVRWKTVTAIDGRLAGTSHVVQSHIFKHYTLNLWCRLSCFGTEPFWFVGLRSNGTAVVDWFPMDETDIHEALYDGIWSSSPDNRAAQSYAFTLQNEATSSGIDATGIIRTEICSDGMSDRDFEFSVFVVLSGSSGRFVQGCCNLISN